MTSRLFYECPETEASHTVKRRLRRISFFKEMSRLLVLVALLGLFGRLEAFQHTAFGRSFAKNSVLMAHAQEGKRSLRRKLAQSKRPVRQTGAAERDVVENADTEQPKYVKDIAPTTALTDSSTHIADATEITAPGALMKNKIPKVELIKIRSNYLFDPLQEEMTDDR